MFRTINYLCPVEKLDFDKDLFEDMVTFYRDAYHLPPLAAKIYAYLIFDFERRGVAFEEFVEIFHASKSSVSANLNLLLNLKVIVDFTKISERRRYFSLNEQYMKIRCGEILSKLEKELSILQKLEQYREPADDKTRRKFTLYSTLFKNNIKNIQDTLREL